MTKVNRIANQLRLLIRQEAYEDGRLPSELELARTMDSSRATIRQALAELETDGLITRKHGSGTFINRHVQGIQTRLEEVWDFDEMIRLAGYRASVRHLNLSLGPASEKIAAKLAIGSGHQVLETTNLFLADGEPVIYCTDYIPAHIVRHAYREEELHGPVYTFLKNRCEQEIDQNIADVIPVVAQRWLARLLGCPSGSALHFFEEIGFNRDGVPVLYSLEYYRPEFFSFKVIRKMMSLQMGGADE